MIAIKNIIVGTAGHIDHGKSSLVEALTGTHPDRLEEEKRRGITIDLGFAFLEEGNARFGFVDVPGHERFVSNMLAGAAGIDMVLLVVAADESIKPQTREHFAICRLLGISRGLIVVTKKDIVDPDTLELVRLEVQDFVRGTFLEAAKIVPVSAKTHEGVSELKTELVRLAAEIPGKDAKGHFRLPIDRSFSVKGFGTVVTGTLISGSVSPEDEVELYPTGKRLRVRGVQSGGKAAARAVAGQRTAVNLAGIDHAAVHRGMVLAAPGRFRATRRIDVRLNLLSAARCLKQRAKVHFHTGTSDSVAEVRLYGAEELRAGENRLAHLWLREPVLVLGGDRFIIRQFSPVTTIGGGVVLDPLARRPRVRDSGKEAFLETLESGSAQEILAKMTERAALGLSFEEAAARTGWTDEKIRATARETLDSGRAIQVSAEPLILVDRRQFDDLRKNVAEAVDKFHKSNPLMPGIPREDLRSAAGKRVHGQAFRAALEDLAAGKKLELAGELVRRAGAVVTLLPEEAQSKEQIEKAFDRAGLAAPPVKEVLGQLSVDAKRAEKLLQLLLREKSLIRVTPELIFHHRALQEMRARLTEYKRQKGERISVPAFKELTGVSRKYAIPLLEYLDRERVTRRAGDERVIL